MTNDKQSIDPETLRRWLAEGRDVQVLDIRKAADRAEWSIPGSIHVDAYEALKAGDPTALANVSLREGVPVVTVCGIGRTACVAAGHLAARGLEAMPLEGGMKGWSAAWNTAVIAAIRTVHIVQFRRTGKGCLSYLIGSGTEAIVVDASLDPEIYADSAAAHGWKITRVLETHVHADHLSRSRLLAQKTGAELFLPDQNRVSFPFTSVRDGDLIPFGSDKLKALRTPGHTLESTCYLLEGEHVSEGPRQFVTGEMKDSQFLDGQVLFTGDTLFPSGVGRPDLGADRSSAQGRASMLFHSLNRLLTLDPSTLVLPGHHGEPIAFNGKAIKTTLGELRSNLPILAEPESSFSRQILQRIPPTPPNYAKIVELNEAGVFPEYAPSDLEAGANRCAVS